MVTNLTRLGAVVIAFDVVFSEPDRLNPDVAADTIRNLDEETRDKLRALPSNDQVFADAMRRSRVVLGESGLPSVVSELDKTLPVTRAGDAGRGPAAVHVQISAACCATSPVLETAAAGRGLFTINPERDGIVRRVPMIMQAQGAIMPSLSFEMLRVVTGTDTIFIKIRSGRHQEHRLSRVSRFRPIATASFGFISRVTIPRSMFRRPTCLTGSVAARKDQGQAGAGRNLGGGA